MCSGLQKCIRSSVIACLKGRVGKIDWFDWPVTDLELR